MEAVHHRSSVPKPQTGNSCSDSLEVVVREKEAMSAPQTMAKPLPPESSKLKFFMKWVGLDLLASTTSLIGTLTLASSNICVHHYMPNRLVSSIDDVLYLYELIQETLCPNVSVFAKSVFVCPIIEQFAIRLTIQEFLLKQLPKKVIGKIAPAHVDLVDSKLAKCARVAISSSVFGLLHYLSPERARMMIPSSYVTSLKEDDLLCVLGTRVFMGFGTGLLLGALQETTGNVAYPIMAQMLHNGLFLMLGGIRPAGGQV